ncbi:pectinesterase inhibitor 3-like [Prosopis cineraria]|uniref:pectinesterase inhibitor 3-like n=1 Tax=Prosopis cineraria TaxID=364024 RepID=UPI00240F095D|nr:pectinesterase inhibitor 3-like [Prosopis cineraria]
MHFPLSLPLLLLLLSAAAATSPPPPSSDLLRSSCVHARYPHLCLRTLSAYAHPAITPKGLAQAALSVSLDHARHLSRFLHSHTSSLSKRSRRRQSALRDCAEQMSDSVDQLSRSLHELKHLRESTFRLQMSNAQTWVSAAMTDDDTCLDGLGPVHDRVVGKIKRKINRVSRVTSNALYMINRLCDGRRMDKSEPSV